MAAAAILHFYNLKCVTIGTVKKVETASLCQMSSKSLKPRPRYGDFSIFYGNRRHLGFLKLQIVIGGTHHACRIASPCQIWW